MVNLNAFDLNLLRVLDAMLRERSTTRAGERIGLSQPAVSAALRRLRGALGDELFVREGSRMVPTPLAASLAEPLTEALASIEQALSGGAHFDPAKSKRFFSLVGGVVLSQMLLPGLSAILLERAPGMRFQLLPMSLRPFSQELAEGTADMAFEVADRAELQDWIEHAPALHGVTMAIASRTNKRLAAAGIGDGDVIPLDLFCEMPQVSFQPEGGLRRQRADLALAAIGRKRRVMMSVPDFFSVAHVVGRTELLGLLPERFAQSIADGFGLSVYRLPFEIKRVAVHLYWHRRHTNDPEHRWMRERILDLLEPWDVARSPVWQKP